MNKFTIFELFMNRNLLVETFPPLTINVDKMIIIISVHFMEFKPHNDLYKRMLDNLVKGCMII